MVAGGLVLMFTTSIVTYTATISAATAECSTVGTPSDAKEEGSDMSMKRFLEGAPLPMEGGKRY